MQDTAGATSADQARQPTGGPEVTADDKQNSPQNSQAEDQQAGNPLHGIKLESIVTALADYYGWPALGQRINIRCFTSEPSVASSLKFLRKTPWARDKTESLYLFMLREIRRSNPPVHNFPPPKNKAD